jgi:6-phosphogluconolactonase/glucosamine-6-phosphate isomerase/deaminase
MNVHELNNSSEHIQKTIEILSEQEDEGYLLLLSGGKTPVELYNHMSFSFNYPFPKDICLVDERWGNYTQHQHSNELVIKNTGLMGRIRWAKSNFHPVLGVKPTNPRVEADAYEKELLQLFELYQGRVLAILGMGLDGHIAGILPESEPIETNRFFVAYESGDEYKHRLTITYNCMVEYISRLIVLVNGDEKCGIFNRIMNFEKDAREFPVLILKNLPNVDVFCYGDN